MTSKTITVKIMHEGPMCAIPVPFDPKAVFGKTRAPVKVTLNGHTYRSTIAAMGGECCLIPLRKSNQQAAGVNGGDTVKVKIELDTDKREVALPDDLQSALKKNKAAATRWQKLSYTHQREHAEALTGAKKPETRARRLTKILEALSA